MRASFVIAALSISLIVEPVHAIIGGEPDGNEHPSVGLLLITMAGGDRTFCSGTLISPTVVLSAAHCLGGDFPVERVEVTFASVVTRDENFDLTVPSITGTPYFDVRYLELRNSGFAALVAQSTFDFGVVVLDRPAAEVFPGIAPSPLPPLGMLDPFDKDKSLLFEVVGYGVTRAPRESPHNMVLTLARRAATAPLKRLDPVLLWLEENPNNPQGTGGGCFGDSGGPVFLGNVVVAVVSFGHQLFCNNVGGAPRLDTEIAREFLAAFLDLP